MTVPSATYKSGPYTGNGVTTAFAYGFRILDASHIRVVRTQNDIDTVLTTGFTVSGVGSQSGGNVTFAVAPTAGQKITLIRNAPFTQSTDLENQGAYYAETVEDALDLAVMRDQQLQEQMDRALKIPVGAPIAGTDQAIATLLAFGAIYLGASSVPPTTRADGSPLTGGELYFDMLQNGLSVYTGSAWSLLTSKVNGTLERRTYTATSGQTVFSVNYDVGFVDVWLNGVKLVSGDDFTATNGTSITLSSGAFTGDSVDIISFGVFAMADMLRLSQGLADLPDKSLALTNLGFSAFMQGLRGSADAAAMRATLGLVIGTHVQAYNAHLAALAALASNGMIARTGSGAVAARTIAAGTGISVSNGDGVAGNPTISVTAVASWVYAGAYTTITSGGIEVTKTALLSASGLSDFSDIFIQTKNLTANTSGTRSLRVSSDGGSSFLSTSIYDSIDQSSATTQILLHDTAADTAVSPSCEILRFNTTDPVKPVRAPANPARSGGQCGMIDSASEFDAFRVFTSGGSITGGTVYVWVRA